MTQALIHGLHKVKDKGSGDVLTNKLPATGQREVQWSLSDYIDHHAKDGSMSFVPIWTTGDTARKLVYQPNTMGGFCTGAPCNVILQIPGFTQSGMFGPYLPGSLSNRLYQLMGRRVTIQHQP